MDAEIICIESRKITGNVSEVISEKEEILPDKNFCW
jgi:hypothetical protein